MATRLFRRYKMFEEKEVGKATKRGRSRAFAKFGNALGILALLLLLLPGGEAQAATLVVTNLNASGPGSLAQAVIDAAPGDTITFSVSGTITIPGSGLYIPKNLTIAGPGPNLLSITGGNINTAMTVPTGVTATVSGITFTQGRNICGDGGAIHVSGGTLILVNSIVIGNTSCAGGGIGTVNGGSTTVVNSTITGNNATIRGGGIVNRTGGTTIITGTLITGNSTGGPGSAVQLDDGTMTISQSCIISNSGGIDVNRSSGTLTAENNWWGVVTGPNTGGETTNVPVGSFLTSAPPCSAVFDLTPPVVSVSFSSPNGQNGWFVTSPVIGSVTADDTTTGGSNITAINCTGAAVGPITGLGTPNASASLTVSAEGVNNVSCTATDSAGNSGAGAGSNKTATVQVDTVAPAVLITSPADGGSYLLDAAVASSYTCTDETSGVATCNGPVASGANFSTSPVGAHTFTVVATDVAGNQAQATNTYNIIYNFSGFFPPVDNPPALNSVKAGSGIPVKFSLNGDQGLSIFDAGFPASQQITCDASATLNNIEETATAGSSSLSYDATTDQYVYVWKTDKGWAGTCRQLIVQLNAGTAHVAYFNFR